MLSRRLTLHAARQNERACTQPGAHFGHQIGMEYRGEFLGSGSEVPGPNGQGEELYFNSEDLSSSLILALLAPVGISSRGDLAKGLMTRITGLPCASTSVFWEPSLPRAGLSREDGLPDGLLPWDSFAPASGVQWRTASSD
jgi:hypothetical protein